MNRSLLIIIGFLCAVVTAVGITWYNYHTLTVPELKEPELYPKSLVGSEWERPQGLPFDKEKITPRVISAFFYNAKLPSNITPMLQAYVEIPCKFEGWTPTFAVAVISLVDEEENSYSDYLVLFVVNKELTKLLEYSIRGGGRTNSAITIQNCQGEENPLVYLFYEDGGNSRNLYHGLYRIERKEDAYKLNMIWNYSEDYEGHSTSCAYKVSNINFCGFDGKEEKRIIIYTTSGIKRYEVIDGKVEDLIPVYNKTIYIWDSAKQSFMKK